MDEVKSEKHTKKSFRIISLLIAIISLLTVSLVARADSTGNYTTTVDDGYNYNQNSNYTTARTASTGTVADLGVTSRVGQQTGFYIYRAYLPFDTSFVPSNAIVVSATLSLYGAYVGNSTDFNIDVASSSQVSSPMLATDFSFLNPDVINIDIGRTSSSNVTINQYFSIPLSSANLTQSIVPGGITKLELHSSNDELHNQPTNDEYIDFYTNERGSGYSPILTIVWTIPNEIPSPISIQVNEVAVFNKYYDTTGSGDQLFTVYYAVLYSEIPGPNPADFFEVQLLDYTGNVTAQSKIPLWGNYVASIDLNSSQRIPDGSNYTVRIIGTDKFATPPTSSSVNLSSVNYQGLAQGIKLDQWILNTADLIQAFYSITATPITMTTYNQNVKVLTETGGTIMATGIPNLNYIRPNIFLAKPLGFGTTDAVAGHSDVYGNTLGTSQGSKFNQVMTAFGHAFGVTGGFMKGFLFLMVCVAIQSLVGIGVSPLGGTVIAMAIIAAGGFLGWFALGPIMIFTSITVGLFLWFIFGRSG